MHTTALIRLTGLTALVASIGVAVPAHAVTTVGNNLGATPLASTELCSGTNSPCTVVPATLAAGRGTLTVVPGVVVLWRVKAASAAQTSIALRVVRGNAGVARSDARTLSTGGVLAFPTRIRVEAGDRLGVDAAGADPPIAAPAALGEGRWDRWQPPLGTIPTPPTTQEPYELLLNADIEADADADGFGDEASGQDQCVGTAGPDNGCPLPPPPPPPPAVAPPPPPAVTPPPAPASTPPPAPAPATSTGVQPSQPVAGLGTAPRITALQFSGTSVRFRISDPAAVTLTIHRVLPGRRVSGRCLKPTSRNRLAPSCARLARVLSGRTNVEPGLNTARLRRLVVGRYRVRLVSTGLTGRTSTFTRYYVLRR